MKKPKLLLVLAAILIFSGCRSPEANDEQQSSDQARDEVVWEAPGLPESAVDSVPPPKTDPVQRASEPVNNTESGVADLSPVPPPNMEGGVSVVMDQVIARKTNLFLSNFAECFFEHFDVQKASDEELIRFGIRHNRINNPKRWLPDPATMTAKINAAYIDQSLMRYFAVSGVQHRSIIGEADYASGWYIVQMADGEAMPFVQVTQLEKNAAGSYTAFGNIYENANYLSRKDPYAPLTQWTEAERQEIELYGRMQATFREVSDNDGSRFVLLTYDVIE